MSDDSDSRDPYLDLLSSYGLSSAPDKPEVGIDLVLPEDLPEPFHRASDDDSVPFDVKNASPEAVLEFALSNLAVAAQKGDVQAAKALVQYAEERSTGDDSDLIGMTPDELRVELSRMDAELMAFIQKEQEVDVERRKAALLSEGGGAGMQVESLHSAGRVLHDDPSGRERLGIGSSDDSERPDPGAGDVDDVGGDGNGDGDRGVGVLSLGYGSNFGNLDAAAGNGSHLPDQVGH